MLRSKGTKLAYWLAQRSLSSNSIGASSNLLNDSSRRVSQRGFVSGTWNSNARTCRYLNSETTKFGNGGGKLFNGVLYSSNLGATTRRIHGTASMTSRNYYDKLGVPKNSSQCEIHKAYYVLENKLHLDTYKGDANAVKKFQEVQKAYEVLKDEEKRTLYDKYLKEFSRRRGFGGQDVKEDCEVSFTISIDPCVFVCVGLFTCLEMMLWWIGRHG